MAQRYLVLVAVSIGYVSIMLAVGPISVSLPTIASSLGVDVAEVGWIMAAYLLALTACLLPAGRLGDLVGYKPVFLAGLALTTAASVLTGFMNEVWTIVALRALQGIGAALVSGTTLAMLTAAFPARQRGRIVGVATVAGAIGAGGGTLFTPMVLEQVSWHGVFWLVAPVGLLSLALSARMPAPPQPKRAHRGIDVPGAVLLAAALLAFSLSFSHLHEGVESFSEGWPYHTGMQVLAVLLLGAFALVERRAPEPLVRIEYLRNARFDAAVLANGIFHMTMMATFFLTPFLFERAWGLSPGDTSAVIVALQGMNVIGALAGGWIVDRVRWAYLPPAALGCIAVGMLLLGLLGGMLNYSSYLLVTVLLGFGSGLFSTSNNTAIMSILPEDARGFSSGMLESTRQFGHTLAVSLGAAAMGIAGASLQGDVSPDTMLAGFQVAEIIMGSVALLGVWAAAMGRPRQTTRPRRPSVGPTRVGLADAAPAP
ncbi:MAG: transporter [Chloroflexi bacterium]|nr:transporter [Chloroflexota bacterium]